MDDPTFPAPPSDTASVGSMVWRFAVSGLLILAGIMLATSQISQDLGEEQAIADARTIARLTGAGIVQPLLDGGVRSGDVAALERLNDVVRTSVLSGPLVRVRLWAPDGRIVYSDESRLIGTRQPDTAERGEARATPGVLIADGDPSAPENRFETGEEPLLDAYLLLDPDGESPLLYQASFTREGVRQAGRQAWLAFAPITIGSLLLLQLVQVPFAWSLARRVRSGTIQREHLLRRALDASDVERRRIAADLHDGVVQDLTGVSYSLSAAAAADPTVPPVMAEGARTIRGAVGQLRSLLVDLYPPDLASEGLPAALEDLLARHRAAGLEVRLRATGGQTLSRTRAALVYRIAQEALRNVQSHAHASVVTVELDTTDGGVHLRIEDDGTGFDPALHVEEEGHFGLRILTDAAAELGGHLAVHSGPGLGTAIELRVPAP